jgi:hypothetical protein
LIFGVTIDDGSNIIERMFESSAASGGGVPSPSGSDDASASLTVAELLQWCVDTADWPFSAAQALSACEAQPADIDVMRVVERLDPATLTYAEQVRVLRLVERHARWTAALQQRWLVLVAGPFAGKGDIGQLDEVAAELDVAGVLGVYDSAAKQRIEVARQLHRRFPATLTALDGGALTGWHAQTLVEQTKHLDDATAALVEQVALRPANRRKTVGAFRAVVQAAVTKADPATAQQKAVRARAERRIWFRPAADTMMAFGGLMPAEQALALQHTLAAVARRTRARFPQDPRTLEQLEVDALGAMAAEQLADPTLPKAHGRPLSVGLTMDTATLFGFADNPAQLEGYGPIPAPLARELAVTGTWRLMIVDAETGRLSHLGTRTYTPSRRLAEFIVARDRTCRAPRCGRPAHRCDLDHRRPYDHTNPTAGGQTDESNLQALCERHHIARHAGLLHAELVDDNTIEWTTRAGLVYQEDFPDLRPVEFDPPPPDAGPSDNDPPEVGARNAFEPNVDKADSTPPKATDVDSSPPEFLDDDPPF